MRLDSECGFRLVLGSSAPGNPDACEVTGLGPDHSALDARAVRSKHGAAKSLMDDTKLNLTVMAAIVELAGLVTRPTPPATASDTVKRLELQKVLR